MNPSETIFVDDKVENLKLAEKLGITTIHFKDAKRCIEDLVRLRFKGLADPLAQIDDKTNLANTSVSCYVGDAISNKPW